MWMIILVIGGILVGLLTECRNAVAGITLVYLIYRFIQSYFGDEPSGKINGITATDADNS